VATRRAADAEEAPPSRRRRRTDTEEAAASYFATVGDKGDLVFFSSGCAGMDAALGGGWPLGRVSNIVGDRSSGKTLLATEGTANFAQAFEDGGIFYRESEAAFDQSYAGALGMPLDRISFSGKDFGKSKPWKFETVEDFYNDVNQVLDELKDRPGLYICDSLDALSADAEMGREIDQASFGGDKAKKMGELFRKLVRRIEQQKMHLMVISQLRDKIGVQFGETKTRTGGRALDFYASHIVWLAEIGKIKRTVDKVDRVTGVNVRARVKKNKVGLAHREFDYPILFGYGIDDLTACVEWLIDVGRDERLAELDLSKAGYAVSIRNIRDKGGERARELRRRLRAIVFEEWQAIETKFLPRASKY
jgi:recombination protein RecA